MHGRREPVRSDRRVYRAQPPGVRVRTIRGTRSAGLRSAGLLAGVVLALALAGVQLAQLTLEGWRRTLATSGIPDPAAADTLISTVTAGAATLVCAWLLLGVLLTCIEIAAPATGRIGATAGRWARRLAPSLLRHGVAALLGVTLGVGAVATALPAVAGTTPGSSSAAQPSPARGTAHPTPAQGLDDLSPGWQKTPPAGTSGPAALADASPGWAPTRPLPRHAADPAVPSRRPKTQAADDAGPRLVGSPPLRPRVQARLGDEVVVRRGDTLWSLAARHLGRDASDAQIALEWPTWFAANRSVIGKDPDVLRPGARLHVPEQGGSR